MAGRPGRIDFCVERISPILVATGNLEFHAKAFHEILVNRATDIIQPEPQWCGGYTACRRIAAVAKHYDIPVIPHGSSVYNYHFVMANANSPYAEYLTVGEVGIDADLSILEGEPLPREERFISTGVAGLRRGAEAPAAGAVPILNLRFEI